MKRVVYTLATVILILTSLSALGVAFMNHSAHQACPFATMSNTDCDAVASVATAAFHHTAGYKALTEVLPTTGASVLLALLLAVVLSFFGYPLFSRTDFNQICYRLSVQRNLSISILNPIIKWIGLHNKRATHLVLT